jgi:starch phosphorylase
VDTIQIASGFTPVPQRINRLLELAYNLWWAWHPQGQDLFRAIDTSLWEEVYHNPVGFLREVRQAVLDEAAGSTEFLRKYHSVMSDFDTYMAGTDTWFSRTYRNAGGEQPENPHPEIYPRPTPGEERGKSDGLVAYFSAEFGLHEALPIYSGGMGILSGDHCKEASDLGLPFVGVGFLYPQGYFRQQIAGDGTQEAIYEKLSFAEVPALPAFDRDGREIVVEVELPGRVIYAKVWVIQVGRVPVYLMDTDIHPNAPPDRHLSARLYGGDREMRLSQEMVLGIGGVRTLRALGIQPSAWHANEGHPAFMLLERARELVQSGLSFDQAAEVIRATSVFTTHTPVPAGHDVFPFDMMAHFFDGYWEGLKLSRDEFLNVARQDQSWGPTFSMTVLGMKLAAHRNGVSQLHADVTRKMWHWLWPDRPVEQAPISAITNGIHTASWLAPELRDLYDQYLPAGWMEAIDDPATWQGILSIPNKELWELRCRLRGQLVEFVRHRLRSHLWRLGVEQWQLDATHSLFDPNALTIGFARRFATYKRATMLFTDVERLKYILNRPGCPAQIVFAGKAHPDDEPGKDFIRQVYNRSKEPGLAGRIVFLENYDINMGRYITQGADLWLNVPRRPYEASGTSGQKAALNGVINCSVSDGWWAEGYNGANGWMIGEVQDYTDQGAQDWEDSQSLYQLLEEEIVPLFYKRDKNGVPAGWLKMVKESIRSVAPIFSTSRMVKDYTRTMYMPAMEAAK